MLFLAFIAFIVTKVFSVMLMWNWFIVPLGVISITYAHAMGITLLLGVLTHPIQAMKDDDENPAKVFGYSIGLWLIVLMGWILTL